MVPHGFIVLSSALPCLTLIGGERAGLIRADQASRTEGFDTVETLDKDIVIGQFPLQVKVGVHVSETRGNGRRSVYLSVLVFSVFASPFRSIYLLFSLCHFLSLSFSIPSHDRHLF